jgi:hypothetical protein
MRAMAVSNAMVTVSLDCWAQNGWMCSGITGPSSPKALLRQPRHTGDQPVRLVRYSMGPLRELA